MEETEPSDAPLAVVRRREPVDLDAAFGDARPRLLRIASSLVGAGGEDAVQDTYLIARRSVAQLRDPAAVDAWLTRICIHRCFRVNRRRRHLERLLASFRPPRPVTAGHGLELRELVEALPTRERTVLVLHHGHGYTLAEVARLVGISHDNARAIASRARRKLLRSWLEDGA